MSEPDVDPAQIPLLFPDPVVEFYMKKIDRAVLRERLKMTPSERLDALMREQTTQPGGNPGRVRETAPLWPVKRNTIDLGGDPAWFAEAKVIPLLVPDPVIEAYLEDVDRGLIRQGLKLSVAERFERFNRLIEGAYELRRACVQEHGP